MTDAPYDYIAEAITAHWGERRPDYEPRCACCAAWAQYDALKARIAVPDGWKCAPRKPTDQMKAAVRTAGGPVAVAYGLAAWHTMLEDSPEPPNDPT